MNDIRTSVFVAILAACPSASTASTELVHIENFSFMIGDVPQETLREIASRVATKHQLAPAEMKRRDPAQPDNRVQIVEFRIQGSGAPRMAMAMQEDL